MVLKAKCIRLFQIITAQGDSSMMMIYLGINFQCKLHFLI